MILYDLEKDWIEVHDTGGVIHTYEQELNASIFECFCFNNFIEVLTTLKEVLDVGTSHGVVMRIGMISEKTEATKKAMDLVARMENMEES